MVAFWCLFHARDWFLKKRHIVSTQPPEFQLLNLRHSLVSKTQKEKNGPASQKKGFLFHRPGEGTLGLMIIHERDDET
jgi:hypothetical protein